MGNRARDTNRDPLASFMLEVLITHLKKNVRCVSWAKNLHIVVGRKKVKCAGLSTAENDIRFIFLDSTLQGQPYFAARMFLHELLHGILNFEEEEMVVRRFERLLWERLTERQKRSLIKRLPAHTKYTNPSEEDVGDW